MVGPGLCARVARVASRRASRARSQRASRMERQRPRTQALLRAGVVDRQTLDALVVARYRIGTCRFAGGGAYPVSNVLDHAVDAGGLLAHARALATARGVVFYDGHAVLSHRTSQHGVRVRVANGTGTCEMTSRVLVDARGAASPYASADLVCPTVGGVLEGLSLGSAPDEVDPSVGEILVTVDGVENGSQHVWEGFPGRTGETTVYLFTYARADAPVSLLALYARFFAHLPSYKRGAARLVRPTFGFIPGGLDWRPRRARRTDAWCWSVTPLRAIRRSRTAASAPCCVRSMALRTPSRGRWLIRIATLAWRSTTPLHPLTGAIAHVMASGAFAGNELNELLDAAFATLHEMGEGPYGGLLRDEMTATEFNTFLRRTAARYPRFGAASLAVSVRCGEPLGVWHGARAASAMRR